MKTALAMDFEGRSRTGDWGAIADAAGGVVAALRAIAPVSD